MMGVPLRDSHISRGEERRVSVRENCSNLDDALTLFNKMVQTRPLPFIGNFNKLLRDIVRMKHYATVVSLIKQLECLGLAHNMYSLSFLINCFCRLNRVKLGFSIYGKLLKHRFLTNVTIFNSLINGLILEGKLSHAVRF
uniref:Pentatricopeptide repeat-containing protein n=1 Tax=Rhizophora mucronata TaxID=61149 RepID=A0A2P2JAX8_RHIMU